MSKKIIVSMCFLLLITGIPFYSVAKASTWNSERVIVPNYTYFSGVSASISIDKGYVNCTGNHMIFASYGSSISITLQQSKDGTSWTNVKSWSQDFSGNGSHSVEDGYYVNSGYKYRVMSVSKVKSGSTVLETATAYSSVISY